MDPVTFEILRHLLWMINDEQGKIALRISGSPRVYDVKDYSAALLTAEGESLFIGPHITRLSMALQGLTKTVLRDCSSMGFEDGDMFFTNDPWAVKPLAPQTDLGARFTTGNGCVMLFNRAPHPAAAKVFSNWLLTREAQESWVKGTAENSRRLDVAGPAEAAARPGMYLQDITYEPNGDLQGKAIRLAKSVLG